MLEALELFVAVVLGFAAVGIGLGLAAGLCIWIVDFITGG